MTWIDTSAIRKHVLQYNELVRTLGGRRGGGGHFQKCWGGASSSLPPPICQTYVVYH